MEKEILKIENLKVSFRTQQGMVQAVRGVSLSMKEGEILAVVGESGCGKSTVAQVIPGLHPKAYTRVNADVLKLSDVDILSASERALSDVRGKLAGMVFQDPMTCLNPTMKIGRQITEGPVRRGELSRREAKEEAVRLLKLVQIPDAELRAEQYPHQFSGGMRQRVMIAMALAGRPKLIIADEPTTALDVTVQRRLLELLGSIRKSEGCAILLISHDLGVVARLADRVAVMYAGQIVEEGPLQTVFGQPVHPYTKGLLACIPVPGMKGELPFIPGTPPGLLNPPAGCGFAPRCPHRTQMCEAQQPGITDVAKNHRAACHYAEQYNVKEKSDGDPADTN